MKAVLFSAAGLITAAALTISANAQQPCWEGAAPSCISPYMYNQPSWPANMYHYPPSAYYEGAAPYGSPYYSPYANSSHAYYMNPW